MPLTPRTLPALLALLIAPAALADPEAPASASFEPRFVPALHVSRAPGPIRIDGELDDAGWDGAARASGFAEVNPGDQVLPAVDSEAWIAYDDEKLYVALIARDDPAEVRVSVKDRDEIFQDDYFGIMLDTYGDQGWGYELFVNPIGIQGDLRMMGGGNEDMSFDLVWESKGRLTETGYQVEIAIPFRSLRFPDRPVQAWRANFWRDRQREARFQYAWAAQDRDNPCFLCQLGTLSGIENIRPGRNAEAIASVIGSQAGALADDADPTSGFENEDPQGDASLNLKYGFSSTSTGELALNPDFSQVESDAGQIDVNTTFALFFPERRPFFQEGSNLYGTWIETIYTRSINDPEIAAKFAGQHGKTSLVYLAARDDASPLIVPLEERSEFLLLDESVSNILRVRRSLKEDAFIGGLVTDRRLEGGGSGTVVSGDALLRFAKNYRIEIQAATSRTDEPDDAALTEDLDPVTFHDDKHTVAFDDETFWGNAAYVSLERGARLWSFDFDYWDFDPSFRTDNGFTTRNDYRQLSGWTALAFRPGSEWLTRAQPDIGIGRVWSHDGRFKDEWLRPTFWFITKGQTEIGSQYLISRERFGPETFPGIRVWSFWAETTPTEMLSGGFNGNVGRGIYRDFDDPELADQRSWGVFLRVKPSRHVDLETDWDYARMDSRERDENLFAGWILRNRISINFTREWFVRVVVQYDEFDDRLDVEPLLTYRINPFTVFFAGSVNRYRYYDQGDYDMLSGSEWRSSSRQFFAKLQYLLQI
ncbi:MAG: DUF5916 domain-containing protein [Candidatus Eiseniibacteriota bacterium]